MLGWLSSFRMEISRMAVLGTPNEKSAKMTNVAFTFVFVFELDLLQCNALKVCVVACLVD